MESHKGKIGVWREMVKNNPWHSPGWSGFPRKKKKENQVKSNQTSYLAGSDTEQEKSSGKWQERLMF